MYQCHIQFYLAGCQPDVFEIIRGMSPLEHFTHDFLESDSFQQELASRADVIIFRLPDIDAKETLKAIVSGKKEEAELILLGDKGQIGLLEDHLWMAKDVWATPMSEEEVRFRFLRWQQTYKMGKDFWETRQFFESTINSVPSLIWYKDKDGIHEKVNDSFCKTVNKTKKQVQGRRHSYIWDVEQDDPACIESELAVMSKKTTCVSEEVIVTGEGQKTLTTYKSPLFDLDGSVMGTVGVGIDVTKEHAYKQEIIRKNRTLETIFTSMDCGILSHSLDGLRILSVNQAALRILGYESQEELMSSGFRMIAASVMEEDKKKMEACIRSLKNVGDSASLEYRVQHKNGKILHVMGNVKLLRENGELFYRRFLLDCTAQKLEEEKNERRQMELIQALGIDYKLVCFYDLDTGIGKPLRTDDDHGFVFSSIFSGKIFLKESMDLYIDQFVYEDDREMVRRAVSMETLLKELEEKKIHYVNYRTAVNNEIKYYQMKVVRAGVWKNSHGIVLGLRSVDEETRKEMEQRSLLEDALIQANKASKAKSVFLSNMSHDIRTPMNAIVGFTTLALAHMDSREEVEGYLRKIMMSGNHLLSLINDVLDMSRIESGKMYLEEKLCSLPEILQGLQNIVRADVNAKQLEFHMDVNVMNEDIYCDNLRLNQVLLNLLSNAIKYTPAGGTVRMRLTEIPGAAEGYGNYEFFVKDTGIGMSSEFLSHIFEPFEREKNTTTSGIQGTGLGMAITKNIIDMMKGTIEVKSEPEAGTEVKVSLLFCLDSSHPQSIVDTEEGKDSSRNKECSDLHTGRILLAEDNELNQEIAVTILEDAGFAVEVADNGKIALDMLKNSEPGYYRLILMDIQMPVMNGYEASREIRKLQNKQLSTIPIFAMTANAFEDDKQEARECGMDGYIAKPINVDTLFETLEKVFS